MVPRVVIAGVQSGVGKTTVATGLMAAFTRMGYRVQGFKAGPDYIDPGYHTAVTGNISRNLDCWMLPEETVRELFLRAAGGADLAVVEGVMGLFDGHDGGSGAGSTALLARYLKAPVILVVDARGMAGSAAALVYGYKHFDPELDLRGVIFNNVGSERHYRVLREAVARVPGVRVLGYLPKNAGLKMPERHLGLVPAVERGELGGYFEGLARAVADTVDLEGVLAVARNASPLTRPRRSIFPAEERRKVVRIAVARDRAFNFYYQDALDLLAASGAELVEFSPLDDRSLPQGSHGIYIGGGFPEMFLPQLSGNRPMIESIVGAYRMGIPIYAECGGLMYLSAGIEDFSGTYYPMVGLFPGRARMQGKMVALGYVTAEVIEDNVLVEKGTVLKGHQFRWSVLSDVPPDVRRAYRLFKNGTFMYKEGVVAGNLLASYLHLHFAAHPRLAKNFVERCRRYAAGVQGA